MGKGKGSTRGLTLRAGIYKWFEQRAMEPNAPAATSGSQASSLSGAIAVAFDVLGKALKGPLKPLLSVSDCIFFFFVLILSQVAAHSAPERRLHNWFLFILCLV